MPKTTVSVISAVVWRLKTELKKRKKKKKRKEKLKHWLKQKLKRLKVTGIRKKNRRNVQKKITDAKQFGGEQTKKEREKRRRKGGGGEEERKRKKRLPAAPGVPRRSPIQVLTGPDVA